MSPLRIHTPSLSRTLSAACFLIALVLLVGCGDDSAPSVDVNANNANTSGTNNANSNSGTSDCTAGELGCACDAGACVEGRCADEVCVACPEGTLRCPCAAGDTCGDGLVCDPNGVCAEDACPPGGLDCPCDEGEACLDGLTCMDSTCVPVPVCEPGDEDCPCDEEGGCADELVCINEVCRDCPSDTAGCPCDDGACGVGLVCDEGACRDAVACVDAGCGEFQRCEEAVGGQDARCLEACEEGFVWDAEAEACAPAPPTCDAEGPTSIALECVRADRACEVGPDGAFCGACLPGRVEEDGACVPDTRANCDDDPDDFNSILAECNDRGRECVSGDEGASCGACQEPLVEDTRTGDCLPLDAFDSCEEAIDCPESLNCIALQPGEDPRCLPAPCPEGETLDLNQGACTDRCDCEGEGLTGNPWLVTDRNGDCVCETEPGYFFNTSIGSRRGEECDADRDGWVRRSAFVHLNDPDEAVRLNARCDLRTIDRVALVNSWGQTLEVSVQTLSGGLTASEPLYETDESDEELEALERQSGLYGTRKLHAAELNPMTKACVSVLDDFNDNGVSDLREHHLSEPDAQRSWMSTFTKMSYYVELHTGRYEPTPGSEHGRYVIAERSRCEASFPVGYDADEGPYQASCARRRDSDYDPAEPLGYDFQRWSCADPDGACPVLPPPVAGQSLDTIPPHGACEERPGDDPIAWRGMGHSSQFKCVEIVSDQEPLVEPFQLIRSQVRQDAASDAPNNLNVCELQRCNEGDPACREFESSGPLANPGHPIVNCEADVAETIDDPEALLGQVAWVAVRYQDYDRPAEYAGGCINEKIEWPQLCPGYQEDVFTGVRSEDDPNNFGKIACGCGFNYGGAGCDVGCPDNQVHYGGANNNASGVCEDGYCVTTFEDGDSDGGRSGFWMCGDFALTSYTEARSVLGDAFSGDAAIRVGDEVVEGQVTIRGRMPTFGTDGTPMCERVDDEGRCSGFTVR